ncbi:autotransporter outer membrane beta-barrel domain-containing protein [Magnetofaba australis]|uniref:Putative Autotransporter beta domain-containing protein n=1 Tax=Magnetofaba australis IT-1 TaxID=1434232 RepID=A0A1Y2K1T3_9PROT|nr:autotransporter outer membrane beta-barrel domain-containing protein [Magnetofaba australis]OSM01912.1 putative Autotransporter beta domain-containing protein [Magnetofaba australis IT-1]
MLKISLHRFALGALMAISVYCVAPQANAAYTYGEKASSNTVVSAASVNQAAKQAVEQVAQRIAAALSGAASAGFAPVGNSTTSQVIGNGSGRATGSAMKPRYGIWLDVANSWLEKDDVGATADFDGTVFTLTTGMDIKLNRNLLIGVSAGYEGQNISTPFNTGGIDGDGYALSPYMGYIINDSDRIDMMMGIETLDYDFSRSSGLITGSTDALRLFGAINYHHDWLNRDGYYVGATLGYLRVQETQDSYTDSSGSQVDQVNIRLGQIRGAIKGSYTYPTEFGSIAPYGSARLEYDHVHNGGNVINTAGDRASADRFGVTFGAGLMCHIGDDSIITLQGETSEFRENLTSHKLSGTVRINF